jgi:purine-binding chemotaxis protein CheW
MELLTFQLSVGRFGIPLKQISELLPMMAIQSIPELPHFIKGAINLRGELLPVVDLVEILGAQRSQPPPPISSADKRDSITQFQKSTRIVLSKQGDYRFAIIVDGVERVNEFDSADYHDDITTEESRPSYLQGMITVQDSITQIIAINQLLTNEQLDQLNLPKAKTSDIDLNSGKKEQQL